MFKLTLNVEMNVLINRRKKLRKNQNRINKKIFYNNSNIYIRGVTLCFIFDRFNKG